MDRVAFDNPDDARSSFATRNALHFP